MKSKTSIKNKKPLLSEYKSLRKKVYKINKSINGLSAVCEYLEKQPQTPEIKEEIAKRKQKIEALKAQKQKNVNTMNILRRRFISLVLAGITVAGGLYYKFVSQPRNEFTKAWNEDTSRNDPENVTDQALLRFKEALGADQGIKPSLLVIHDNSTSITPDENNFRKGYLTDLSINKYQTDENGNLIVDSKGNPKESKDPLYKYSSFRYDEDNREVIDKDNNMPDEYKKIIQLISKAQTTGKIADAQRAYLAVSKLRYTQLETEATKLDEQSYEFINNDGEYVPTSSSDSEIEH